LAAAAGAGVEAAGLLLSAGLLSLDDDEPVSAGLLEGAEEVDDERLSVR
jgi:hypothetical protein